MQIPCGQCRTPAPRLRLHRLGNRLLCPACFSALTRPAARTAPGTDDASRSGTQDARALVARTLAVTGAGLLGKAVVFLPLFFWARASDTGAAALRGAVGGDVLGWAILSLFQWPFRRAQVGAGAIFEVVLVALYLQRTELFEITSDLDATAMSVLFFFFFLLGKAVVWAVERLLDISGVTENG